ncbi:hypothetical protein BGZ94_008071 [Podila epigama]|nr:hypothetical protein BGZ94_008071 [Podila epigama]
MSAIQLVAGTFVLVGIVGGLLSYFGNRTQHAWRIFLFVRTLYEGCTEADACNKPFLYVSGDFLLVAWRTMYWSSFALTWALIPLLQAYTQSGEFTVMKRFRSAVRYNIIYQLVIGSVALLGLVYVSYTQGTSNLRAYVMALSNSWGLILVVIFMGYGMVDVPRRLWHMGDNARELRRIAFKASVVKDKRQDTEDELLSVAKLSDPLRPHVDKMVKDFPAARGVQFDPRASSPIPPSGSAFPGANVAFSRTGTASGTTTTTASGRKHITNAATIPTTITEKYLADLHARIKWAIRMNDRWTAIWRGLLKEGFLAQDIQENADNPEKKFRSSLRPMSPKPREWQLSFEWHWHLKVRPILLRASAIVCAVMSLLIVWSEMTYNHVNPILSVISLLIKLAWDRVSYGAIEAISFLTMLYMCTCAYTTLMKMKLLNNYVLVPNHHTDEPTLLFIGSYLCRLTFPLVYNYLTISASGKEDSTVFAGYMGKIDMVPFLGGFNYYMPYVILVPTLITLFNVFAKMFAVCSISDNFFDNDDEDGGIGGDLEEGLHVLKDARREEERRLMPERTGRNRDSSTRRGTTFENYTANKNRSRGPGSDTSSRLMLGEGSSSNAWRDVRPYSSNRPSYQEQYFDDSTDDDELGGQRQSTDGFGALGRGPRVGFGGVSGVNSRGSFDTLNRPNSYRGYRPVSSPALITGGENSTTDKAPGTFRSLWQKFVQKKPAIVLNETTGVDSGLDSDDARSSLDSYAGVSGGSGGGARSGPALMFASVRPGNDRGDDMLSPPLRDTRASNRSLSPPPSSQSQRAFGLGIAASSLQNQTSHHANSSRNSRPSSRIFGTSSGGGGGGNFTRPAARSPSPRLGHQSRPLVNIFDEDDDV